MAEPDYAELHTYSTGFKMNNLTTVVGADRYQQGMDRLKHKEITNELVFITNLALRAQ